MRYILAQLGIFLMITATAQHADVILVNGKIFTADANRPYVSALAIKGDRLVAIGSDTEIQKFKTKATKLIDLAGRTVTPGFNDAHDHAGADYPARQFVLQQNPTDATTWERVRDSIVQITSTVPAGTWIRTTVNPELFADARARLQNLDSIAPNHPVLLAAWTGHGVIVNSKAMQLLGYDQTTTVLGGWLGKDAAGKANGVLHEYANYPIDAKLALQMPKQAILSALTEYEAQALSMGITSHQVMATELPLSLFREIYASPDFKMRTRIIAFPFTNDKRILLEETLGLLGPISKNVEVTGIKLILDGTPIERLAFMSRPYDDAPNESGHLDFDEQQIRAYIQFCIKQKQQIMVHAVGDASVKIMIKQMRSMHPDAFWKSKRVRMEHADFAVMTTADLDTLARMGIIIVQNPMHLALPGIMMQRTGNRTKYLQAMRSLLQYNVPLAIGSDGPINPYLNIMMAVLHPDNPAEALTVEQAVTAYTTGSAYAEFKEKEKGKLLPGMLADMVVLSQDIFTVPANELPRTQAVLTMVGGKIVYEGAVKQ